MSAVATQDDRLGAIETPLGEDALLLRAFEGEEALSGGYAYRATVEPREATVDLAPLLGAPVAVLLARLDGEDRAFRGIVTSVTVSSSDATRTLVIEPWFALLGHARDSRVYRELDVVGVVDEVFARHGAVARHEWRLTESYPELDFVVQYDEADDAFVSRLLERFGIYWFVEHDGHGEDHVMVLADHASAHEPAPGQATLPYDPDPGNARRDEELVHAWHREARYAAGRAAVRAHDWRKTHTRLEASESWTDPDTGFAGEMEQYRYPGGFTTAAEAARRARARAEALRRSGSRIVAETTARGPAVGQTIELAGHDDPAQDGAYLVAGSRCRFGATGYRSGQAAEGFACALELVDLDAPFRPPEATPRPHLHGVHTATVTGPDGEEIWTDEHGCVRLKFPWDRSDHAGERASGWVRVSQRHAGRGFGASDVPRVGEEVLVEFVEGDPDRPVVVGRVHNDFNAPTEDLPARAAVTGMRGASTPGGGGYNEWRFDDRKGEESFALRAEKDMTLLVQNDLTRTVDNAERSTIGADREIEVGGAQRTDVTGTIDVAANGAVTIESAVSITLKAAGSTIELGPAGITIETGAMVTVKGSMIKLN